MVDFAKYENKLPFPLMGNWPEQTARVAYMAEEDRLRAEFKRDVLAELNLTEHPKAEQAFELAWDNRDDCHGSSQILPSVYSLLQGIAALLLP